ncbi:MAG: hypothetical protein ACI9HK_006060, partial [Pirellulaceae bacterium]
VILPVESLREIIMDSLLTDDWEDYGGPAMMANLAGLLVVSHHEKGHRQLASFLDFLRRNLHTKLPTQFIPSDELEDRKKVEAILAQRATLQFFEDEEIADALQRIRDEVGLKTWVDQYSLTSDGINTRLPDNLNFDDERIETIVHNLVRAYDKDIIYGIENDTLILTVEGYSISTAELRTYSVDDILVNSDPPISLDQLFAIIRQMEPEESWYDYGGENFVVRLGTTLLIKQQREAHQRISQLLRQVRDMAVYNSRSVVTVPSAFDHDNGALFEKLQQPAEIHAEAANLRDVLDGLEDRYSINFEVVDSFQFPRNINFQERGMLGELLSKMMGSYNQYWNIQNGRLKIVNRKHVFDHQLIRIYRIPDRVSDIFDPRGAMQLESIIKAYLNSHEWEQDTSELSTVTVIGGLLIARCSIESHANIESLINALDKNSSASELATHERGEIERSVTTLTNWSSPAYFTRLYPIGHIRSLYPRSTLDFPYIPISRYKTIPADQVFATWNRADPIAQAVNACLPRFFKGVVSESIPGIAIGDTFIISTDERTHKAVSKMLIALEELPHSKANLVTIDDSNAALVQIKSEVGYSPTVIKRIAMAAISPGSWDEWGGSERIVALENILVVPTWSIEDQQFFDLLVWLIEQPNLLEQSRADNLAQRQTAMESLAAWIAADDPNEVAYSTAILPLLDEFSPKLAEAVANRFLAETAKDEIDVPHCLLLAESLPRVDMPEIARNPALLKLLKKTNAGSRRRRKWIDAVNNLPNSVALQTEAFDDAFNSEIILLLNNLAKYKESRGMVLQRALKRLEDKVLADDHFSSFTFIRHSIMTYDPELKLVQQRIDELSAMNDQASQERVNNLQYRIIGSQLWGGGGFF